MKRYSCLFFLIAALPLLTLAQPTAPHLEWMQLLNDQDLIQASDICLAQDGGFAIAGVHTILDTIHGDKLDAYLTRLNSNGDLEWTRTYGHPVCYEQPEAVVEAADGGYVMAGLTSCDTAGTGNWGDLILLRTDGNGDSVWYRQYDMDMDDMAFSIARTNDGGYILGGWEMIADDANPMHCLLMKVDANGDSAWTRVFQMGTRASAYSVKQTQDGGYVLAGINAMRDQADNIYVVKTDGQGSTEWERAYGLDTLLEPVYDVVQTPDGGYAVSGWVFVSNERSDDAFILRLAANGDSLWMHTYGPDTLAGDEMFGMELREDGGFVLGGHVSYYGSRLDSIHPDPAHPPFQAFELIGVSATGEQEWIVQADSAAMIEARGMCRAADGGYVLAGTTYPSDTSRLAEIRIVKFANPNGTGNNSSAAIPATATLEQNYPNPFNPTTQIAFSLPRTMEMKLTVYDVLGREVARLANGVMAAGEHRVAFDGSNLASGVYFYKLNGAGFCETKKMLLMK